MNSSFSSLDIVLESVKYSNHKMFSSVAEPVDPEEEEKRRTEARREKQRRRREKNSEKYGDGYTSAFTSGVAVF